MNINYASFLLNFLKAAILLSIVTFSVFIAQKTSLIEKPLIASAITFDLIITLPFAYWFFIRKTKISKQTVSALIFFGFIIASFILPENNRTFLDYLKYFALPLMELGFLAYAGFIIFRARKTFKSIKQNRRDFLETLRETLVKEFPNPVLAKVFTFEIAGIYYAFFAWKAKRGKNNFTYHKQNGVTVLLFFLGFVLAVEIIVMHILIAKWSAIAAWILTAFSLYFLFQIYAHGKAIFLRPVETSGSKLFVRCGLLGDAEIDLDNIKSVEKLPLTSELENHEVKLSPLGDFTACNLKISLRDEAVLNKIYGIKKNFKTVFLSIDKAETLKTEIEKYIEK